MGASSSQPAPDPLESKNISPASPVAEREPHRPPLAMYSPKMDDIAASQQLMEEAEGALRASHAIDEKRGKSEALGHSGTQIRKSDGRHEKKHVSSPSVKLPASQPPRGKQRISRRSRPVALNDIDGDANEEASPLPPANILEADGTSPTSQDIVVPDSQVELPTTTTHALMSPPMVSSTAPASGSKKQKKTYKKARRSIAGKAASATTIPGNGLNGSGKTAESAADAASPPISQPERKRKRAPTSTDQISAGEEPDMAVAPSEDDAYVPAAGSKNVAESDEGPATSAKRPKKRRGMLAQRSQIDPIEDDEIVPGRLQPVSEKSQHLKKAKTGRAGIPFSTQDNVSSPPHEAMDVAHTPVETVRQTPRSAGTTPKGRLIQALITPSKSNMSSSSKPGKKRGPYKQTPRKSSTNESRRRFSRNSGDTSTTAADRALNSVRDLNRPHDLRESGDFSEDEEELIRRAIRDYQERHGLDTSELVEIIQWTSDTHDPQVARKRNDWTPQELLDAEESKAFWEELKQIGMKRPHDRVKSHVRSRYHTLKTGDWTEEEDEQLKSLMELHPRRWKLMALVMGNRSQHDIYNRWKDYLQYGENRNTSRWSKEEEHLLLSAINIVAQRDEDYRAEIGKRPRAIYRNADINWPQVCVEMGKIRSRLQCTVKWTQMKKRDPPPAIQLKYRAGRTPDPDEIVEPTPRKDDRSRKSTDAPSEDGRRSVGPTPRKRGRPRKSEATAGIEGSGQMIEQRPKKRGRPRTGAKVVASEHASKKKYRKSIKSAPLVVEDSEEDQANDDKETAVTTPNECSPSKERNKAAADKELESTSHQTLPVPQTPQTLRAVSRPRTPGVAQMRMGDKLDLVEAVALREPENEEDIDWYDLAATMKQSWSIRTLQTALKELRDLVIDQGNLTETAIELMTHLTMAYDEDQLKEHYDPYQDLKATEDTGPVRNHGPSKELDLEVNKDDITAATLPNTKKKRKLGARHSLSRPHDAPTKRKKAKTPVFTSKQDTSSYLITESDVAESEQES